MTIEQMCARAMKEGFIWVIEINENEIGDIISTTHECSDRQLLSLKLVNKVINL